MYLRQLPFVKRKWVRKYSKENCKLDVTLLHTKFIGVVCALLE